jgi:predicted permease
MILSNLRSLAARFLHRGRTERELEEELQIHIQLRADALERSGLGRNEAERRARIEFGGRQRFKEECLEAFAGNFIDTLIQDVRFSLRMLRKSPGFTMTAILTLALGIGATTAIFGVVDGVVLKPLPYWHSEQLVSVEVSPLALDPSLRGMAPEDYFVFREQNRTFEQIGIYAETDTDQDVNVTGFAEPERVHALNVTHDVLSTLAARPMIGRVFLPSDDSPGAPATAILTYAYWQRHFSGEASVIGKTIRVDGKAREIIGVMPRDFRFLDVADLALILPLQLDRNKTELGNFSYFGIARLKPEITIGAASTDVARMLPITLEAFAPRPGLSLDLLKQSRLSPSLRPLKEEVVGNVSTLLWVVMSGVGIVLLIACANIANLLLVRTEGRHHELALRAALGATRRRIALQLLQESLTIGVLGSIVGFVLAYAGLHFLVAFSPAVLPRMSQISINSRVLYFTFGITLFASLLFGLIPAFKYSAVRAGGLETRRILGPSRERHRARNFLVTTQIALAVILLICAGLMIRTFVVLTHVNPGFVGPSELQTFRVAIPTSDVADATAVTHIEQQIQDKLAAIPGVSAVAFTSAVPLDQDARFDNVFAEDRAYVQGAAPPVRHLVFVSPGYFSTLGIPLIAGRDLTWADIYSKAPVALISENFAREYWRTPADALGKRIRIRTTDDWSQIIGVVGNVHDQGMDKPARTNVYWPALQTNFWGNPLRAQRNVTFVVRSPLAGSESLLKQVRQAVWSVDGNLPLASVYTLNHLYTRSLAPVSFTLIMLGTAGAVALLLGAVGLYGVIAYSVARRTREIGVRVALGAQRNDVVRLFLREGMSLIVVGLPVGLAGAFAITRLLSSLLFGVRASDPLTFACAGLVLALVAFAACQIPARRALRIDPMEALRCE